MENKTKIKAILTAGATAVVPLLSTGVVHAEQVTAPTPTGTSTPTATTTTDPTVATSGSTVPTNPNPATNLPDAQPAPTEANTTANANAGTSTGSSTVSTPITDSNLDKAVTDAKDAGVTVTTGANKDYTNIKDAQSDLASQTKAVQDATAQKQANTDAINSANAKNAQIDKDNAVIAKANADADAKHQADLATYDKAKQAYDKALADKATTVTSDTVFTGRGVSELLNSYGQTTSDKVTIDQDGNWVLKEPQSDMDGTFGYTTVKGKFIYTTKYDPASNKSVTVISAVQLNSWQLDLSRGTTAIDRNISATYKDINGNVLFSKSFNGLSSIGAIAINKTFALAKTITLSSGQTSPEFMLLKTAPNWVYEAPSSLYAKLSYNTSALPTNPTPPTAPTPTALTPHVGVPTVLAVNVAVHPVSVSQTPKIVKDVVNTDGVSVDGHMVPKNSTDPFILDLPTLNAGRPVYKDGDIIVTDALPVDLGLSVDEFKALNPDWVITFDEATNVFSAKPSEAELAKINQTGTGYEFKDLKLPASPLNDNGTYENTYSLQLAGYKVYSNKVVYYTPGTDEPTDENHGKTTIQPTKKVLDTNGNDINGKSVPLGGKIVYVAEWDNDQYKDIVAGALAISKGFGYIDNYDEKAVTLDMEHITIKTADGTDVTGLKAYVIKNLADAPQEIKDLVANAEIKIADNDEFVIWVAEDPKAFFDNYTSQGKDIFFTMPATVHTDFAGDRFENVVYQIDFGNGYAGNVVYNTVERPTPETPQTPQTPVKATPEAPKGAVELPYTGDKGSSNNAGLLASVMAVLGSLGLLVSGRKKQED